MHCISIKVYYYSTAPFYCSLIPYTNFRLLFTKISCIFRYKINIYINLYNTIYIFKIKILISNEKRNEKTNIMKRKERENTNKQLRPFRNFNLRFVAVNIISYTFS